LKHNLDGKGKRSIELSMETGASTWLSVLPIKEYHYNLNKQQFWDVIAMRYNWPIPGLPARCVCSEKFDVQHALYCKKGGFITLRHNEIRDITSDLLNVVCKDVESEPHLIKLNGEENTLNKSAKKNDEVRLDVSARGFWIDNQKAFFDIRVFDPYAKRYMKQSLKQCYVTNEKEKKNHYNKRILEIDQGSFTPLVFNALGGMGNESKTFISRLCLKLATVEKSLVTNWVRTKLSFALLRSLLTCIRGSRTNKVIKHDTQNIELEST